MCAALSTELESEVRAVTSGRVLRIVIEKVGYAYNCVHAILHDCHTQHSTQQF